MDGLFLKSVLFFRRKPDCHKKNSQSLLLILFIGSCRVEESVLYAIEMKRINCCNYRNVLELKQLAVNIFALPVFQIVRKIVCTVIDCFVILFILHAITIMGQKTMTSSILDYVMEQGRL